MPIRSIDPFHDHLQNLRPEFNRFVARMHQADSDQLAVLQGPALQPWVGRWRQYFENRLGQNQTPSLILEIGSHLGEVILNMAREHPDVAFLGMDITLKRVITLSQKAKHQNLPNILSLLANARGLDQLFADRELDGVLLFFPDPWAKKKRQQKNRLANKDFFLQLASKLSVDGFFWFKTDCLPYFEDVEQILLALGWRRQSELSGIPGQTYTSRFERLFVDEGLPTYASVWKAPISPCKDSCFQELN